MTVSLNIPVAGSQNWDVPVNANWNTIETALNNAAPLNSPALTGTPTAPTAASTVNNTQIATTAYVVAHRCTTAATTTSSASIYKPAVIVENYKSGNNWYRKWSDGWIEQGGNDYGTSYATNRTINFNIAFTQNNPTVVIGCSQVSNASGWHGGLSSDVNPPITKTGFSFKGYNNGSNVANGCSWYACGY